MALTYTKNLVASEQLLGGLRVQVYELTFTGATSGTVKTGLRNVVFAAYTPDKTDDHGIVDLNDSDASGTTELGSVHVSSVTSGDTGSLLVIGV